MDPNFEAIKMYLYMLKQYINNKNKKNDQEYVYNAIG